MNEAISKLELPEEKWRERLDRRQYYVLRKKGTDRPFTGKYTHPNENGIFECQGCGLQLFSSQDQFDSGSGWPSFTKPIDENRTELSKDYKMLLPRTEVICSRCGGHLGHLFNDGPKPLGTRWCINSTSLRLQPTIS